MLFVCHIGRRHSTAFCHAADRAGVPPPPHHQRCSPDTADKFVAALPGAQLVWVEECGHCAHLEQPQALLRAVCDFCGLSAAAEAGVLAEAATA